MTGDKSLFKPLKEKVGDYVTFGDGSHAQVLGKGIIEISGLPLLKDVLYIKGLKVNLLSITQIFDEDFLVQFSKKGCTIINVVGIQVLEGYRTTDNCYGVVPTPNISCRSARVDVLELWHQRLGHANFKQVAKVSKLEAVVGLPKFRKVEFLREKSEACEKMETLCKKFQSEKSVPIVKIRSDHGKEFENAKFESFCEKNEIKKEFSSPKTPQPNEVVERKNRVIQEMARVMPLNKQIPQKF
ncbi:uncharacterized protein LOC142644282 [Castanea sativa]|uniref:uncharacterized protein LOC142644282 n=1 Tax=Castanea sativa TaxID=21020 RepID=UPI003F64DECE